jgi:hypothetical protein
MFTTESRREWLHRFGAHLMKLQPKMNAVVASQHAVAAFDDAADVDPILAAETAAREAQGVDADRYGGSNG